MPCLTRPRPHHPLIINDLRRRDLLIAGGALLGLAGCGGRVAPPPRADTSGKTIEHMFGDLPVPSRTDRVVTLGFVDHDAVLALGVVPVAVNRWYKSMTRGVGPWAEQALGPRTPHLFTTWTEIAAEEVAALDPDVILAIYFKLTEDTYQGFSQVAPTLAQPADTKPYLVPWRDAMRLTSRLLDRADDAEKLIDGVNERIAEARAAHPEFAGKTISYVRGGTPGLYSAYTRDDLRIRLLTELGFRLAPAIDELERDKIYAGISAEKAALLEADVLVATHADMLAEPTVSRLDVVKRGAAFVPDADTEMAVSASTVLSIPYALDRIVDQLAAALK